MRVVKFIVFAAVFIPIFIFVFMSLWNWLMPALFGWRVITFWQAAGLFLLSKILFGGFRPHRGGPSWHWRRRMIERWEQMTPEEREQFRQGLRCGPFKSAASEKTEPTAKSSPA